MSKPSFEELADYFNGDQRIVTLPGIKTTVELPYRVWFRYDGEVQSLLKNLAMTECVLNGVISTRRNLIEKVLSWPTDRFAMDEAAMRIRIARPDINDLAAYQRHYRVGSRINAHVIAKKSGLEKSKSIFADGHESGEFLAAANLKEILQKDLDQRGIKIVANDFIGEDFADIAGMLALRLAIDEGQIGIAEPVFRTRNDVLKTIRGSFGL